MKYIGRFVLAFFLVLAMGCAKSEEGTSETSSEPESIYAEPKSIYKGQIRALRKTKNLENTIEKSIKNKAKTLDEANQ